MQEQNNNEIKPIVPIIPSELPSHMEMFSDPIASLEISVTCYDEEFAAEQEARMKSEIASGLKWAIKMGTDYSNSKYQNVRRNGKTLTYEYYKTLLSLIFDHNDPLVKYNQYEVPKVHSVTYRICLDSKVKDSMDMFDQNLQQAVQDGKIDNFSIDGLTIVMTSSAPNPFRKLFEAYTGGENKWRNYVNAKESIKSTTTAMGATANSIMATIAIIMLIIFFIKVIL